MSKRSLIDWLDVGGRILIALLFIYAGIPKILNPAEFTEAIDNYRMLPYVFVPIMATILPYFEVIAAIALFFKKFRSGAAFGILVMCLMFELAIGTAVIRGLDINCGCFVGPGETNSISIMRLFSESLLFGLAIFVYYQSIQSNSSD